jgi:hypothetical protein
MSEYCPIHSADTIKFSTWQARKTITERVIFKASPYVKDRLKSSAMKTTENLSAKLKLVPWFEFFFLPNSKGNFYVKEVHSYKLYQGNLKITRFDDILQKND